MRFWSIAVYGADGYMKSVRGKPIASALLARYDPQGG